MKIYGQCVGNIQVREQGKTPASASTLAQPGRAAGGGEVGGVPGEEGKFQTAWYESLVQSFWGALAEVVRFSPLV